MSEAYKREENTERGTLDEEETRCPECGIEKELEARFCQECGHDFLGTKRCPKCGFTLPECADICEACGAWLLEGQCKFCYAALEEGAQFCAECGNPVDGVECPQCHNISYFDFCKYCNIPLTEEAIRTIEDLKNSEDLGELIRELEHAQKGAGPSPEHAELEQMREYLENLQQCTPKRKTLDLSAKGGADGLGARIERVQQERKVERQEVQAVSPDALEKIQRRTFTNNQEARRFSGALKVLLPTMIKRKVTTPLGWLCNVYGVLHPDGPQGCSAPYGGGRWIHEEREVEEKGIGEVEI